MMVNSNLSKTNNIKSTQSMETYISDNITSLATSNKRSNGARYASIKAGIRTGLQSPFLGVGQGLGTAYIAKNFTSEERKNGEVKMWLTNQQKQGIMKAPIGAMNEYVQRFAENGCIGLTVFLTPFIFVLYRAVKILLKSNGQSLELITLLSALVGCLVAGMNGSLNLMFTVWVVLGLLYAAILVNENTGSINERA
ncbi:MAG: O-antigen ligase family protein [Phascolarctobacterium sp.]|nr:O-antigen ligase family protein [Phascolarctobacterium sp.]